MFLLAGVQLFLKQSHMPAIKDTKCRMSSIVSFNVVTVYKSGCSVSQFYGVTLTQLVQWRHPAHQVMVQPPVETHACNEHAVPWVPWRGWERYTMPLYGWSCVSVGMRCWHDNNWSNYYSCQFVPWIIDKSWNVRWERAPNTQPSQTSCHLVLCVLLSLLLGLRFPTHSLCKLKDTSWCCNSAQAWLGSE